jgi:HPP family protein
MQTPTVSTPNVGATSATRASATQGFTEAIARFKGSALTTTSDTVWMPAVAGALMLLTGVLSLSTRQPWLFVALGPTAVTIGGNPGHQTVRVQNIVVGHLTAIVCAWLAVMLVGAGSAPDFLAAATPATSRMWAGAIAVALTAFAQPTLRAYHPPAAATALLLALGLTPLHLKPVGAMVGGAVLVALLGAWFQRVRLTAIRGKGR